MKLDELKSLIQDAGIAGCGGAGFPSYAKLSNKADTIILNCAECEPLFRLHRQLLKRYSFEIISTLDKICQCIGAKEFHIAMKRSYKTTAEAVERDIQAFPNGKTDYLYEAYPAGDELVLIYDVTGKTVPAGGLPIDVGVIVYNVETILNVYHALNGEKVTHKYVTVGGAVKNPQTYRVPIGTPLTHLVELSGGATEENTTLFSGGPMTGRIAGETETVTKTTNGILVLPDDNPVIMMRRQNVRVLKRRTMSACCQCQMCTDMCPRHLLGYPIEPHRFMRGVKNDDATDTQAYLNTQYCSQCGLCEMVACKQGLNPRTLIGVAKQTLAKNGIKNTDKIEAHPLPERNMRRLTTSRLRKKLDLEKYNNPSLITDEEVKVKTLYVSLRQNIGAPSVPVVKEGDSVKMGDMIASAPEKALGLPIHAPVDGKVLKVSNDMIVIKSAERK